MARAGRATARRLMGASLVAMALANCGGGGGSGTQVPVVSAPTPTPTATATPTPTPTPTATPTPTPTPTATTSATLLPPLASQSFDASIAQVRLDQLNASPYTNSNVNAVLGQSGSVRLAYSAANNGYTLFNVTGALDFSYAFTSADLSGDDGTLKQYQQTTGTRTSTLQIFDPGAANSYLSLTYVSYASLLLLDAGATSSTGQFRTVVYGVKTAAPPTTGTVTYTAVVDGLVIPVRGSYRPLGAGTATITVDFATRTITGSIRLVGNDDPSGLRRGTNVNFGTYALSGSFAAGSNAFTLNVTTPGLQFGAGAGNFFGPQATEIGLSVAVNDMTANNPVVALSLVGKAS